MNFEEVKKSNKNDNEMLEASNQLLGGFSSGFSFMEDEENDKIDGGSYCSLDSNINIQTMEDSSNFSKDGTKKDISSKYEELMKEREGEFKGIARLG